MLIVVCCALNGETFAQKWTLYVQDKVKSRGIFNFLVALSIIDRGMHLCRYFTLLMFAGMLCDESHGLHPRLKLFTLE